MKPSWCNDVDHEISQAIHLYLLLNTASTPPNPDAAAGAARTAFSAHFRSLMEFFHDGRPSKPDWRKLPSEPRDDIEFSEVLGSRANRFSKKWSRADLKRFADADKLLGHLSKQRASRRRMRKEWGCEADWRLLLPKILTFLDTAQHHATWYPKTLHAARLAGLI